MRPPVALRYTSAVEELGEQALVPVQQYYEEPVGYGSYAQYNSSDEQRTVENWGMKGSTPPLPPVFQPEEGRYNMDERTLMFIANEAGRPRPSYPERGTAGAPQQPPTAMV